LRVHPRWSPCFSSFYLFCCCCPFMCLCVLSSVLWCPLRFPLKIMFGSSLPLVVCRKAHVLFRLSVFICVQWYPTHIVLCFCFVFICFVYPMFPVSLDCPCLINPSVFSNAYLQQLLLMRSNLFSREHFPIPANAIATLYLDDVFFVNLIPTLKTWNTAHMTLNNNQ